MEIVIHDDTYKDVIEFRSISKLKLSVCGPDNTIKDCRVSYTLMVGPEDSIAAVKPYIHEKSGFYFNRQKLLLNKDEVLRDDATNSFFCRKKEKL
ncbi:hypothetical protein H5410_053438 [Solanum commersonii]|uniref:Ubiquitin-like domain-containing protein n=1 Tax=Solanum commersonii TaxID=4109 RepID=A0A9J5X3U9_SOLCO|nr:hypothetical protein H5410_053438 [Solanum commersonii]